MIRKASRLSFGMNRIGAVIVMGKTQQPGRTMIVLAISAAIYAAYLPLALWLGHTHVPVEKPQGQMVQLIGEISHIEGFAYRAPTPFLITYADTDPDNQRSPIILYENLTPLGPPHSVHS